MTPLGGKEYYYPPYFFPKLSMNRNGPDGKALAKLDKTSNADLIVEAYRLQAKKNRQIESGENGTVSRLSHGDRLRIRRVLSKSRERELTVPLMSAREQDQRRDEQERAHALQQEIESMRMRVDFIRAAREGFGIGSRSKG